MLQLSIQSSYKIIASVSPTQFFELIERDISILSSRLMPEFSTRHDTFLFREVWVNLKAENTIDQLSNYRGIVDPKRNILHACVRRAELGDLLTLWECLVLLKDNDAIFKQLITEKNIFGYTPLTIIRSGIQYLHIKELLEFRSSYNAVIEHHSQLNIDTIHRNILTRLHQYTSSKINYPYSISIPDIKISYQRYFNYYRSL